MSTLTIQSFIREKQLYASTKGLTKRTHSPLLTLPFTQVTLCSPSPEPPSDKPPPRPQGLTVSKPVNRSQLGPSLGFYISACSETNLFEYQSQAGFVPTVPGQKYLTLRKERPCIVDWFAPTPNPIYSLVYKEVTRHLRNSESTLG